MAKSKSAKKPAVKKAPKKKAPAKKKAPVSQAKKRELATNVDKEMKKPIGIPGDLRPAYDEYIANVSPETESISWELTVWIWEYLVTERPKNILDAGSGFSSALFRRYAADFPETMVYTLDTQDVFLQKTKEFLKGKGLNAENMFITLAQLHPTKKYDFVSHDYGRCDSGERAKYMPEMYDRVKKGGVLLLDDIHKTAYWEVVRKFLGDKKLKIKKLLTTKDKFGRYSGLVTKK